MRNVVWLFAFCVFVALRSASVGQCDLNPRDNVMPQMHTDWQGPDNQFVTTTLEDGNGWWWGTDNDGLWKFLPDAPLGQRWQHFRAEDGLYDDSITALCRDKLGRLWVGTERRGVSVYNNSWWQNFDFMAGPIGCHINAIVVNPTNGDVWIASEDGISIYSQGSKQWSYRTMADGLASDKINCIAFTSAGAALVGTTDNGIDESSAKGNYRFWTNVTTAANATVSEVGAGLPGNQINCILAGKGGHIFCGTSSGLAESMDDGKSWVFLHGWNWQKKITRFAQRIQQVQATDVVPPLNDDYVTSLAYDRAGLLYIGHRFGGLEVYNDATQTLVYHDRLIEYGTYIRSLTVLSHGGVLVGNYGDGLSRVYFDGAASKATAIPPLSTTVTTFPSPAKSPTDKELNELASTLSSISKPTSGAVVGYLGEDWQTQGNWMGRYGLECAVLCAADGNQDYVSAVDPGFTVTPSIGINSWQSVSHWLQWEQSGDPRVLYDPETKNRREAEWDDQGESSDILSEGPDIWITVQVPVGFHRISLYFMNKDGHTQTTRFRDYTIQLMQDLPGVDIRSSYDQPSALPVLAEARVENFWPGVYESFAVAGSASYYFKISRNFSLNTIIQGVFIDSLTPQTVLTAPAWMAGFSLIPIAPRTAVPQYITKQNGAEVAKIKRIWSQLDSVEVAEPLYPLLFETRIELLRAAAANGATQALLAAWRTQVDLWTDDDWSIYEQAIQKMNRQTLLKSKSS